MWTLVREEFEFERPTFSEEEGKKVYIGRLPGDACRMRAARHQHVVCKSSVVSRKHCLLEFRNGNWFICDLGSMNGTFVNETKLEPSNLKQDKYVWTELKVGDFIGLGTQRIPDEDEDANHPRTHYFIFKFVKMRPEATPSPTEDVEEIAIDSDDNNDGCKMCAPVCIIQLDYERNSQRNVNVLELGSPTHKCVMCGSWSWPLDMDQ